MLYIARKDGTQFYADADAIELLAAAGYDIVKLVEVPVEDAQAEALAQTASIGGAYQAPEPKAVAIDG